MMTNRIQLIKMMKLMDIFKRSSKGPLSKNINRSIFKNLNYLKLLFSCSAPFIDPASDPDPYYFNPFIDQAVNDSNFRNKLIRKIDGIEVVDLYEETKNHYTKDIYIYKAEEISVTEIDSTCEKAISETLQGFDQNPTNKVESIRNLFETFRSYLNGMDEILDQWESHIKGEMFSHISASSFKNLNPEEKIDDVLNELSLRLETITENDILQIFKKRIELVIEGITTAEGRNFFVQEGVPFVFRKDDFRENHTPLLNYDNNNGKIQYKINMLIKDNNDGKIMVDIHRDDQLVENFLEIINGTRDHQLNMKNQRLRMVIRKLITSGTPLGIISNLRWNILLILGNEQKIPKDKSNDTTDAIGISIKYRIISNTDNNVTLMWAILFMIKTMDDGTEKEKFMNSKFRENIMILNQKVNKREQSPAEEDDDSKKKLKGPLYISSEHLWRFAFRTGEEFYSDIFKLSYGEFKELMGISLEQNLEDTKPLVMKCFTFATFNFIPEAEQAAFEYSRKEKENLREIEEYNRCTDASLRINIPTCYGGIYFAARNESGLFTNVAYAVLEVEIMGEHYDKRDDFQKNLLKKQISNMHNANIFHRDLEDRNIIYSHVQKKLYIIDWAFEEFKLCKRRCLSSVKDS